MADDLTDNGITQMAEGDEFEGQVLCPYCEKDAELVTGDVIYPNRTDLKDRKFYHCEPCNAYVGCHGKSDKPFGTLANADLRKARSLAHMHFDKLWKFSYSPWQRNQAYAWLRKIMGLSREECHIGMFDLKQCQKCAEMSRKKMGSM